MMRKTLASAALGTALVFGGGAAAAQADTPTPTPTSTVSTTETQTVEHTTTVTKTNHAGLWGLLGLAGLAGLAGLRKRPEHHHEVRPANVQHVRTERVAERPVTETRTAGEHGATNVTNNVRSTGENIADRANDDRRI